MFDHRDVGRLIMKMGKKDRMAESLWKKGQDRNIVQPINRNSDFYFRAVPITTSRKK